MISCLRCGQQNPDITVRWNEVHNIRVRKYCQVNWGLPDDNLVDVGHDGDVYIVEESFRDEYVDNGFDVDTEELDSDWDGYHIDEVQCRTCGCSGKITNILTSGDELDALLNQLGNALKSRR